MSGLEFFAARHICAGLLLALIVSGCVPRQAPQGTYYHPRTPESGWHADWTHCQDATAQLRYTDKSATVEACMKSKGYVFDHSPPPAFAEADFSYENEAPAEFYLLDSTWHDEAMGQARLDYLKKTGVEQASLRSETYARHGVWFRLLIGAGRSHAGAERLRGELAREYGLRHLLLTKQEYGPNSLGSLIIIP